MALQRCSECGRDVSTKAATCPNCGAPIKQKSGCLKVGCLTAIIILLLSVWLGKEGHRFGQTLEDRNETVKDEREQLASENTEAGQPIVQPKSAAQASPQAQVRAQWYQGGTLHRKTMKEWRSAAYADRLATTADFVAGSAEARGIALDSMDEFKKHAVALEREISAAGEGGVADSQPVAQIAVACMVLMDSQK